MIFIRTVSPLSQKASHIRLYTVHDYTSMKCPGKENRDRKQTSSCWELAQEGGDGFTYDG